MSIIRYVLLTLMFIILTTAGCLVCVGFTMQLETIANPIAWWILTISGGIVTLLYLCQGVSLIEKFDVWFKANTVTKEAE